MSHSFRAILLSMAMETFSAPQTAHFDPLPSAYATADGITDRLEAQRLPWLSSQMPLARDICLAVGVSDLVAPTGQGSAQLNLEGMTAVVVYEDPHLGVMLSREP